MDIKQKGKAVEDAWDSGELGRDEGYARKADDVREERIDDALELQLISVRLQKSLIESLKIIAKANGIGYQPLIRQILTAFAHNELKRMARDWVAQSQHESVDEPTSSAVSQRSTSRAKKAA